MTDLEQYITATEPSKREKATAWNVAIGLQAVDDIKPSSVLYEIAEKHIEGKINYDEAKQALSHYYETQPITSDDEREANDAAVNIAELLTTDTFVFSPAGYANIHRRIFTGIFPHAGKYRDVNITKKEWILNGDTVLYSPCDMLSQTLAYDFEQERNFQYRGLSKELFISHFSRFIAGIWQIHPFREGNTRTTAVFAIKYLRQLGYKEVNNDPFSKHAKYFRNALVRANYNNIPQGIYETTEFLELFFRNVLLGEDNELKKRHEHIDWQTYQKTIRANDANCSVNDENCSAIGENCSVNNENCSVKNENCSVNLKTDMKIIRLIQQNPHITRQDLSSTIGKSIRAIDTQIAKLKKQGKLERIGSDKTGYWKVK